MTNLTRKQRVIKDQYMLRTKVAYCAFLYEIKNESAISDYVWDMLASKIDVNQSCGDAELDAWYKGNFSAHTGSWIHNYPQLEEFELHYKKNGFNLNKMSDVGDIE